MPRKARAHRRQCSTGVPRPPSGKTSCARRCPWRPRPLLPPAQGAGLVFRVLPCPQTLPVPFLGKVTAWSLLEPPCPCFPSDWNCALVKTTYFNKFSCLCQILTFPGLEPSSMSELCFKSYRITWVKCKQHGTVDRPHLLMGPMSRSELPSQWDAGRRGE